MNYEEHIIVIGIARINKSEKIILKIIGNAKQKGKKTQMNDVIFYGDGTQPKRNTRLIDLIDQETKDRWKAEEEARRKGRTDIDVKAEDVKRMAKQPLKDFVKIISPEDSGNIYLQQKQASYNRAKARVENGEVLTSKDEDLPCTIKELQELFRQDGLATVISFPIGKTGSWKLRKM